MSCSTAGKAPAADPQIAQALAQVPADVTEFRCPLSKDNYYFAVRACSAEGHPGLPGVAR